MRAGLEYASEKEKSGDESPKRTPEETEVPEEFSDLTVLEDGTVISRDAMDNPEHKGERVQITPQGEKIQLIPLTDGRKVSREAWMEAKKNGTLDKLLNGAKLKLR